MEKWNIPKIDNRFVCIADNNSTELSAVISSYFLQKGLYFPVFIFPNVNTNSGETHTYGSDGYISAMIGNETSVLIGNSISRMTGCEYVIYAGLSEHQKRYLGRHNFDVIVVVTLGKTSWKTSIFPDKHSGSYLLPLKALVRKKEGIFSGDKVSFSIQIKP